MTFVDDFSNLSKKKINFIKFYFIHSIEICILAVSYFFNYILIVMV